MFRSLSLLFCVSRAFFSFSFSQFFSKEQHENILSCFQVDSKTVVLSEDRTVIMALVVLISSASAGFRGCQKWNKCKGCSNSVRSASTVMCSWAFKNFSFGVRWSTEYECYVCANCTFWERTVSARQVSWLYCGWSVELNLSTISKNCFSQLSLLWACLVAVHGLPPKVCCLPASSILDPVIQSSLRHVLAHTQTHSETQAQSCAHSHHQIHSDTRVCVCVWLSVTGCVSECAEFVWMCVVRL